MDIIEEYVVPFAPSISNIFLLQSNNARPRIAGIVQDYLANVGIEEMTWPTNS